MRQRNRLLEEGGDPRWLAAIEAQMAELGASVHLNRTDSLVSLQALIAESLEDANFPAALLSLTPLFEDVAEPATSAELESLLAQRWHALRGLDRAAGRTTSGPHRVDLDVVHAQKSMPAALGSTGEQKALLIGLILAHARLVRLRTGIVPFLLLLTRSPPISTRTAERPCSRRWMAWKPNVSSPAPTRSCSRLWGSGHKGLRCATGAWRGE
jgi:DNA replication and repair protein RecF